MITIDAVSGGTSIRPVERDELHDELDRFIRYLEHERRASVHTRDAYARDLASLAEFLRTREPPIHRPADVDVPSLRAWLGALWRTHAPASVARKMASARALFRFLKRRRVIAKDPTAQLAS